MIRGASKQVALEIQLRIQRDRLGPDDFLGREGDLAAQFGVSRPTVREALRLLASGNLVRAASGPGGGIFVARTAEQGIGQSLSDALAIMLETGAVTLAKLLDAQLLLEVPMAGRAAQRADDVTMHRLRTALEAEAAAGPGDVASRAVASGELHRAIVRAAGNEIVEALLGWIFDVVEPSLAEALHHPLSPFALEEQHRNVVAAIRDGDPRLAERVMEDHLLYLRRALEEQLAR